MMMDLSSVIDASLSSLDCQARSSSRDFPSCTTMDSAEIYRNSISKRLAQELGMVPAQAVQ